MHSRISPSSTLRLDQQVPVPLSRAGRDRLNFVPALVGLLTEYPKRVIIALAHMVEHLSKFNISRVFRKQTSFKQFMERNHMLLNANTLTNLYVAHSPLLYVLLVNRYQRHREIYHNETNYKVEGSLLGILNKTKTKFGLRKLRELLGRPLLDIR